MSTRKERATSQNMKITYYEEESSKDFKVGILGSRKVPYILHFHPENISCGCPDFKTRGVICKHIYFIIHLAKNYLIFNTVQKLDDLKNEEKIITIRENLASMIDKKKMDGNNSQSNTVSIERDDCCSICFVDLEGRIEKCSQCEHCFHFNCLDSWWSLPSHYHDVIRGKCPYCRNERGLSHVNGGGENSDPWETFNFKGVKKGWAGAVSANAGTLAANAGTLAAAADENIEEVVAQITTIGI